jgi:hypothetical protein
MSRVGGGFFLTLKNNKKQSYLLVTTRGICKGTVYALWQVPVSLLKVSYPLVRGYDNLTIVVSGVTGTKLSSCPGSPKRMYSRYPPFRVHQNLAASSCPKPPILSYPLVRVHQNLATSCLGSPKLSYPLSRVTKLSYLLSGVTKT